MEKIKVWTVSTNDDLTEGRGRQYVKHFCKAEATARRLAKGGYVQGSDCPVDEREVLELNGQYVLPMHLIKLEMPTEADLRAQTVLDRRAEAYAKAVAAGLSKDDIEALRK